MIFNALLLDDFKDKSDYQISMILGIPVAKVKKLRYEAELRYNRKEAAEMMSSKLVKLLETTLYKQDKEKIEFYVDNESLRSYINDILIRNHSYADTSFNRGIVSMSLSDLGIIIETLRDGSSVKNRVMELYEEAKKSSKQSNKNMNNNYPTFRQLFPKIMLELLRAGNNVFETINGYTCLTPSRILQILDKINPFKLF